MTQFPGYTGMFQIPSMGTVLEGVENQPWFGKWEQQMWLSDTISGATRDAANTVATLLRPGLLLGKVTSSGLIKEWNPAAADGTQNIFGVLGGIVHSQQSGTDQQRYVGFIQVAGSLYSDRLIIPGNAAEGIVGDALEFLVLAQLRRRFILDRHLTVLGDDPWTGMRMRYFTYAEDNTSHAMTLTTAEHGSHVVAQTLPSTVAQPASGTPFNNTLTALSADAVVNLPAPKRGLMFAVSQNVATRVITVKAPSGTFSVANNAALAAATGVALNPGESAKFIGIDSAQYQVLADEANTD